MAEKVQAFMDELALDVVEERIVEYVIREVRNGRKLADVLNDPYVKNRLNEQKLAHVLENPEVGRGYRGADRHGVPDPRLRLHRQPEHDLDDRG